MAGECLDFGCRRMIDTQTTYVTVRVDGSGSPIGDSSHLRDGVRLGRRCLDGAVGEEDRHQDGK